MITHNSIGYSGRLGNQMFQYAALKSVALKNGYDYYLPNNIKEKIDGAYDFTNNIWISYKLELLNAFELTCKLSNEILNVGYEESNFYYNENVFNIKDNNSINGYFQSYKYFKDYEIEIKKDFTFKQNILNKCIDKISYYNTPISIHVRRGDYVKHPKYLTLSAEYYNNAINKIYDYNSDILIFSDDIEWCKDNFSNEFHFIENNNHYEDMCMMSMCNHNIISNSTFSWWSAYLNNKDKIVVAPSQWFTDYTSTKDLYPKDWIIL